MKTTEKRQFNRLNIRLPITSLECSTPLSPVDGFWTTDISSGGMHFNAASETLPDVDTDVAFEVSVPPGEGYSLSSGTIKGTGRIVRVKVVSEKKIGIAIMFTKPLMLEF